MGDAVNPRALEFDGRIDRLVHFHQAFYACGAPQHEEGDVSQTNDDLWANDLDFGKGESPRAMDQILQGDGGTFVASPDEGKETHMALLLNKRSFQ